MRPGKRRALDKDNVIDALIDKVEKLKAGIRAKVEHPLRVIKCQLGHVKVRCRRSKKNPAQLHTLFALSNLWMARHKWMAVQACVRLQRVKRPVYRPKVTKNGSSEFLCARHFEPSLIT